MFAHATYACFAFQVDQFEAMQGGKALGCGPGKAGEDHTSSVVLQPSKLPPGGTGDTARVEH